MGLYKRQKVAPRSQGSFEGPLRACDHPIQATAQRQLTTMVPDTMVLGASSPRLDPGFTQGLACGWYNASPKASCTQAPAIVARRFSCDVPPAIMLLRHHDAYKMEFVRLNQT